jgi:uncharacterized tellurite resistance protein B-like protein
MGLFSGLRGKGIETLDLQTAVMVPIVAAMLADGTIEDDEINQIRSICSWSPIYARNTRDQGTEIILRAIKHTKGDAAESMCRQVAELLSPGLRETAFIFAVRMVFSDGHVGQSEEKLIENLVVWLELDGARARSFVETVSVMQHTADA